MGVIRSALKSGNRGMIRLWNLDDCDGCDLKGGGGAPGLSEWKVDTGFGVERDGREFG